MQSFLETRNSFLLAPIILRFVLKKRGSDTIVPLKKRENYVKCKQTGENTVQNTTSMILINTSRSLEHDLNTSLCHFRFQVWKLLINIPRSFCANSASAFGEMLMLNHNSNVSLCALCAVLVQRSDGDLAGSHLIRHGIVVTYS